MAKNIHVAHVEDLILERGREGALYSIQILEDLMANKLPVTTKWDGNPAIVCGVNPENNQFFVGTKAVFNKKNPRICYTPEDIDNFYHEHPDLAHCLLLCLTLLPEVGIKKVIQGEFMFARGQVLRETIDRQEYFTFRPNNICYAFPAIVDPLEHAKMGIVFHTWYEGPTMQDLVARYDVDVSVLQHTPNVWYRSAQCQVHVIPTHEIFYVEQTREALAAITNEEFEFLFSKKTFIQLLKQYFNHLIRTQSQHYHSHLISFIENKNQRYVGHARGLLSIIDKVVLFQKNVVTTKHLLMEQLERDKMYLTFDEFMIPTPSEGFVTIASDGTPIKLVNRPVFSHMNFKRFAGGSPTT